MPIIRQVIKVICGAPLTAFIQNISETSKQTSTSLSGMETAVQFSSSNNTHSLLESRKVYRKYISVTRLIFVRQLLLLV
jgi:hypothetical protein